MEGEEKEEVQYRGVSKLRHLWQATVCHNSRRVHLKGPFYTAREADLAARRLLGAGVATNFLPSGDLNASRLIRRTGYCLVPRQEKKKERGDSSSSSCGEDEDEEQEVD